MITTDIKPLTAPPTAPAANNDPKSDPTVWGMIYGAIDAYEYYTKAGLTQAANQATQFLLSLHSQYTFTDVYAQQDITVFCDLVQGDPHDLLPWWDGLKKTGLTAPNQPTVSLESWMQNNSSKFDPYNLPGDKDLNIANYTLYSDMFFLEEGSKYPEMGKFLDDPYFTQTQDSNANAGALCLPVYKAYDTDPSNPLEPGSPEWPQFVAAVEKLALTLDPSGQKNGMYLNIRGISLGVIPDPYSSMEDYFAAVQSGEVAPQTSSWKADGTLYTTLEPILAKISSELVQFKQALASNDHSAAVQIGDAIWIDVSSNTSLKNDSTFMHSLQAAIQLTNFKTSWSVNTPSGTINLGNGTAGDPPFSSWSSGHPSYQVNFPDLDTFNNTMSNQSSTYPGFIPDPSAPAQWLDQNGNSQNGTWLQFVQSLGAWGSALSYGANASMYFSGGQTPGTVYTVKQNSDNTISVLVYIQGPLPSQVLDGLTPSIDANSNPNFNDFMNNYFPS